MTYEDTLRLYKAGLYIRLSKEDKNTGESESIQNQRKLLLKFAEENNIEVKEIYSDDGFSGTSFERPAFKRMTEDIESKKINLVITKDLSRLGRDYIMTGYYIEKYFPLNNVRYISLLDGIDTGREMPSNEIAPFKSILNDMYAADISKKIKSVKRNKQQRGEFIGGKAPYGYILKENKLYIDENVKDVIKLIYYLCLEGKTSCEIAEILDKKAIPCPSVYADLKGSEGKRWNSSKITEILKSEIYTGTMVQGKRKKISYKIKKCVSADEEDWVKVANTHKGIITYEEFASVREILNKRRPLRKRTYDNSLKGLVFCSCCQKPMGLINRKNSKGEDVLYFICRSCQKNSLPSHIIKAEAIEKLLKEKLDFLATPYLGSDEAFNFARNYIKDAKLKNNENRKSQDALKALEIKIEKLCCQNLSGILEEEDFKILYKKLINDRNILKSQIKTCKKEKLYIEDDKLREIIAGFKNQLSENKAFLLSAIDKIEVSDNKCVTVYFAFYQKDCLP